MTVSALDRRYMAAAIRLARWHEGRTGSNPSVATLIVREINGAPVIVGRGITAIGGRPHAEPQALAQAGELARGATAYVTLEPCAHHGRTPPCAEALVAAGVSRVVAAATDPDERVPGRGYAILRAAGIGRRAGNRGGARSRRIPDATDQKPRSRHSQTRNLRQRKNRSARWRSGSDHRRDHAPPGSCHACPIGCDPDRHWHGDQ